MAQSDDIKRLYENLAALELRKRFNRILYFTPYEKQADFIAGGKTHRERLLMAANQVGKSEVGALEAAMHATGDYPDWWPGRRWDRPTRGWAAGETGEVVRDVQQKKLFGTPGVEADYGTGMVPKDRIIDRSMSRGTADAFDTVQVRHKSGGVSTILFKSYNQGRTKFQGDSIDWGWADEEPDEDIYSEFLTRTTATDGMLFMTFTPLLGISKVVARFMSGNTADRMMVTMTIDDAQHIPLEKRRAIIEGYPAYQREARARGIPMMGEGAIFQIPESAITIPTLEHVPAHWAKIWGIDFGIAHPFAASLLLWDKDNDVIIVHFCIRMTAEGNIITPINHAHAIKQVAEAVPIAWPHDGNNRDHGSGEALAAIYKGHGLKMLGAHATFPGGGNSVEAGIAEMEQRMVTGRWKVEAHCVQWFEEYRLYHRKNGQVVKERDDLLCSSRYALMMRRYAARVPLGRGSMSGRHHGREPQIAHGVDFDPLTF